MARPSEGGFGIWPVTGMLAAMTATEIVNELKGLGGAGTKRVLMRHGITEPLFGVKVGDLKKIQKRVRVNHQLALDLYDTGIYDAMYLAGLIADDARMTPADLRRWADNGRGGLCAYTVAWVAAGGPHARAMALEWIESDKPHVAATGWSTLGSFVAITGDARLDLPELKRLLQRVQKTIHDQPNGVRSAMNHFVISLGTYVRPLTELVLKAAEKIGKVEVDVGDTECVIPYAPDHIRKCIDRGTGEKKRKMAKC
jgi:3-methyladenine DNA glycosylase AlkD